MRRNRVRIRFIFGLVFFFIWGSGKAINYPKPIQKKIDKAVKSVFPFDEVVIEELNVEVYQMQGIHNFSINRLKSSNNPIGFACFASSKGKSDFFDYMVLFNTNFEIQKVVVLVYRSSYGGEIMSNSWLKQFEGKTKGEEMEFGKDIDSISGATISAPSISKGIKNISLLLSELSSQGKIPN